MERQTIVLLLTFMTSLYTFKTTAELNLPSGIKQEAYCSGCKATVEALAQAGNYVQRSAKKICTEKYLPDRGNPHMDKADRKSCKHLFGLYDQDISNKFDSLSKTDFSVWLCHEKSYACMGVFSGKDKKKTSTSEFDDEAIRKLIEENKHRIKTPHPDLYKDEL
ncbi:unnamed protein product [Clavelina lepadiformis]|uniref:Saposin B-type domain-containing protein n=1 Tax=Clavelina lepadiformis TaxID=159417 RepID=A0ABP0F0J9_CLALP